jgi:hypothetical protein
MSKDYVWSNHPVEKKDWVECNRLDFATQQQEIDFNSLFPYYTKIYAKAFSVTTQELADATKGLCEITYAQLFADLNKR